MRNLNFTNLSLGLFLVKKTFLVVLFILMILAAITVLTSRTSLLFGIKSYTVLTGSMSPTIPTGSVIYIDFFNPHSAPIFGFGCAMAVFKSYYYHYRPCLASHV